VEKCFTANSLLNLEPPPLRRQESPMSTKSQQNSSSSDSVWHSAPPELLHAIFLEAAKSSPQVARSLCLTSSWAQDLAIPWLYHTIHLTPTSQKSFTRSALFHASLSREDPTHVSPFSHTRNLSFPFRFSTQPEKEMRLICVAIFECRELKNLMLDWRLLHSLYRFRPANEQERLAHLDLPPRVNISILRASKAFWDVAIFKDFAKRLPHLTELTLGSVFANFSQSEQGFMDIIVAFPELRIVTISFDLPVDHHRVYTCLCCFNQFYERLQHLRHLVVGADPGQMLLGSSTLKSLVQDLRPKMANLYYLKPPSSIEASHTTQKLPILGARGTRRMTERRSIGTTDFRGEFETPDRDIITLFEARISGSSDVLEQAERDTEELYRHLDSMIAHAGDM
jgi:hypothetical protein